jgi:hypothetical protein
MYGGVLMALFVRFSSKTEGEWEEMANALDDALAPMISDPVALGLYGLRRLHRFLKAKAEADSNVNREGVAVAARVAPESANREGKSVSSGKAGE